MAITINGTTGIAGVDGSASTPALQGTDTNTGITFGTNEVNISTDGTTRATVDSSGRLLVGTSTAPSTGGWNQYAKIVNQGNTGGATNGGVLAMNRGIAATSMVADQQLGVISFGDSSGNEFGTIICSADAQPGSNDYPGRLTFYTTADSASSPTERMRISQNGALRVPAAYTITTGNAANCSVQSDGTFQRSTSSIKYKTDVETLENEYADNLLNCRPVWYRSLSPSDNAQHSYWGFIAEEVAAIDPRLVHWKTVEITYDENGSAVETSCDPEPEGVQYDRFVPHLLNLIKRQGEAIAELQAEVQALKGGTN